MFNKTDFIDRNIFIQQSIDILIDRALTWPFIDMTIL